MALDADTGTVRWRFATSPDVGALPGTGVASGISFDVERHLLFVGTGQNYEYPQGGLTYSPYIDSVLALRYDTTQPTGELVWQRQFTIGDVYSSVTAGEDFDVLSTPIVANVRRPSTDGNGLETVEVMLAADKKGYAYAMHRDTGEMLWTQFLVATTPTQNAGFGGFNAQNAYGNNIYYLNGVRPKPPTVEVSDTFQLGAEGALSEVIALHAGTGEILWRQEIDGGSFIGIALANGVLYHATSSGLLSAFRSDTGALLARFPTRHGRYSTKHRTYGTDCGRWYALFRYRLWLTHAHGHCHSRMETPPSLPRSEHAGKKKRCKSSSSSSSSNIKG